MKRMEKNDLLAGVKAVLIGMGISLLVSVAGVALAAVLMGKGSLNENQGNLAALLINFLATLVGCIVCTSIDGEKILIRSAICGAGYLFVLTGINILGFEGRFSGLFKSVIAVVLAVILAALLKTKLVTGKRKSRFKIG